MSCMLTKSAAALYKSRRIDEEVAAPVGVDRLLGRPCSVEKSPTTNNAILFQAPESEREENEKKNRSLVEMGKFPQNGNLEEISLLSMIVKRLHQQGTKITQQELEQNPFLKVFFSRETKPEKVPLHTTDIKNLFPIANMNHCTNFGSFGCPPLAVTLCQNLYQTFIVDSDADSFYRNEIFIRCRDVRRALADYIELEDEDELFLTDNAGEAMNILLSSLMFNPLYLKYQTKMRNERLGGDQQQKQQSASSSSPPVFKILMFTNAYPMVQECVDFHMNRLEGLASFSADGKRPYSVEVEKIVLTREMMDSLKEIPSNPETNYYDYRNCTKKATTSTPLFIKTIVDKVLNENFSCLIIDHIMFSPTLIAPIDEIARQIKSVAPETLILIDGAHAIGQIRLDFSLLGSTMGPGATKEPLTSRSQSIDGYLSNCHKWLGAPKSSAILYVRKELHPFMHPTVISNQHRGDQDAFDLVSVGSGGDSSSSSSSKSVAAGGRFSLPTDNTSSMKLHSEFLWKGTRDATQFLCIPDLLWFRKQFDDERWQRENRALALRGAKRMAEIWKTEGDVLLEDCPAALPCMVCVKFPSDSIPYVQEVMRVSTINFTNFIALAYFENTPYARVGAQVYNCIEDFEYAAEKFLESMQMFEKEGKK